MTATTDPITLTCPDCGQPFTRTAAEQRYYDQHAAVPPADCPECRAGRRAGRNAEMRAAHAAPPAEQAATAVGPVRGRRETPARGETRMYQAVCADCGRPTEVPFQPKRGRPVFCRDCFNARRGR
jgi:CxxC-x17-CxxC domain-containing protein